MAKWVCSKWNTNPKDEEKWEVLDIHHFQTDDTWRVANKYHSHDGAYLYLPKSDYVETAAPERWVDVTSECYVEEGNAKRSGASDRVIHKGDQLAILTCRGRYRLKHDCFIVKCGTGERKQWAFVLEKREDV